MRALVVDDNTVDRKILAECLKACGFVLVVEANNGADGLARYEESVLAGEGFDLILLDWMMPAKDGLKVAQAIRQTAPKNEIALMMITSVSDRDRVRAAASAGVNDFIVKPLKTGILREKIRKLMAEKSSTKAAVHGQ